MRVVAGVQQFVSRDSVRGRYFGLFLARNCLPAAGLHPLPTGPNPLEAESPWFPYHDAVDRPMALDGCWQFLITLGFQWLNQPDTLSPSDWLFRHNIRIIGATIIRPRGKLP